MNDSLLNILGCSLYAVDSRFIHIMKLESSTIEIKLFEQTCLKHFNLTRIHTWINDEWLLYSFDNWSSDLFPLYLVEGSSKTTKLLVTDHSFSTFAKFSEKLTFLTP